VPHPANRPAPLAVPEVTMEMRPMKKSGQMVPVPVMAPVPEPVPPYQRRTVVSDCPIMMIG
jgi:hypothetical protein